MFEGLFQSFMGSPHGQSALQQLGAQGFAPQQAHGIIATALPAAYQAMQGAMNGNAGGRGLLDLGQSHYVMNFMSGAVAGLIRGDGLAGGAIDGLEGVVGGQIAEVVASRCGLPQRIAGMVGAALTPLMVRFLWEKFQGTGQSMQQAPGMQGQPMGFNYGAAPAYNPAQFNPYSGVDMQPVANASFYNYRR
jgi:hypothetical protein